jgi:hypothetical protein
MSRSPALMSIATGKSKLMALCKNGMRGAPPVRSIARAIQDLDQRAFAAFFSRNVKKHERLRDLADSLRHFAQQQRMSGPIGMKPDGKFNIVEE